MRCFNCMTQLNNDCKFCPICGKPPHAPNLPHHLAAGTVLSGKYLIGNAIGEGGFGITYLGFDQTLMLKVAVKEYFPTGYANRNNTVSNEVLLNYSGKEDLYKHGKDGFLSEARSIAAFSSESGVVDVRDYFTENNTAYIVMEYLEGVTLGSYVLDNGALLTDRLLEMMLPLMRALEKMHRKNIIHRDIAPDNIMLLGNGGMKLTDFGAARYFSGEDNKSLSVVLKPGYAPYEQYSRKGVQGPWTDVYALCATIYRCITGTMPPDALDRVMGSELKKPSELGAVIDPDTEAALMKGLELYPKDRLQSVSELMAAIRPDKRAQTQAYAVRQKQAPDENPTVYAEDIPEADPDPTQYADDASEYKSDRSDGRKTYGDGKDYAGRQKGSENYGSRQKKKLPKASAIILAAASLLIVAAIVLTLVFSTPQNPTKNRALSNVSEPATQAKLAETTKEKPTEAPKQDLSAEIDSASKQMKSFSVGSELCFIKDGKIRCYRIWPSDIAQRNNLELVTDLTSKLSNNENIVAFATPIGGDDLQLAVNSDGKVVNVGRSSPFIEKVSPTVSSWTNVVDVYYTSIYYVMALKSDGTLVTAGDGDRDYSDALNVGGWTDIKAFSSGLYGGTMGLKPDGTVVYTDYEDWMPEVTDVAALPPNTENNLFLKKDGTLAGIDSYEHEDVKGWTDLVAFHENNGLIVGLKKDGTVVASGETKYGACNVSDWADIVAVKTNYKYTIGKKSDGTFVIATNDTQLEKEFNKVINGK